ncbi:MAG: hypothetical protein E6I32_16205 [Chloroflexi bacterium]|nr:MAG: hypothetical protein E6I32_16205 [Chloroflexota bacterium]
MVTTGELRAIIEELQLVDIGDAASYLGEEAMVGEESLVSAQAASFSVPITIEDVDVISAFSMSTQ